MHFRALPRVLLTSTTIALLASLLSIVAALAGDSLPPIPR